jgi:cobalt/nickel transport system permease protein
VFVVQLLFIYRYLFVLMEEGARMVRARSLRSFDRRGGGLTVYGSLVGHLLLRTVNRAQRIYNAMVCRGFDGNVRITKAGSFKSGDFLFIVLWFLIFSVFRFVNVSQLAGIFASRLFA